MEDSNNKAKYVWYCDHTFEYDEYSKIYQI